MPQVASFFVAGVPVPKGSAKSFWNKKAQKTVTIQDNADRQKPWASIISLTANQHIRATQLGPVILRAKFFMPRCKGHLRKNGTLKPSAPRHHIVKPDSDKLLRCVMDALTGIAYLDDAQVIDPHPTKEYAPPGQPAGVEITVSVPE
jgi:crossover junction endodeoxyribonuclease RusA